MSLPSINFLHLTVSEIQPGQIISRRPPTRPPDHPDTMGENNTPTAIKGCGVKTQKKTSLTDAVSRASIKFFGCAATNDSPSYSILSLANEEPDPRKIETKSTNLIT